MASGACFAAGRQVRELELRFVGDDAGALATAQAALAEARSNRRRIRTTVHQDVARDLEPGDIVGMIYPDRIGAGVHYLKVLSIERDLIIKARIEAVDVTSLFAA